MILQSDFVGAADDFFRFRVEEENHLDGVFSVGAFARLAFNSARSSATVSS